MLYYHKGAFMKILGLIVEYNPFTKGHLYHIQKAKELVKPDLTVAIMSGNFVQRGQPAIINKWQRAKTALENGVDLVLELPLVNVVQGADYFAAEAIDLLYHFGITDLVFGSEANNLNDLITIAKIIKKKPKQYNQLVKQYMQAGYRYPNATNQALITLTGQDIRTPNDILGLGYVKEIINHDYPITIHSILRTDNYHDTINPSASKIREAIKNQKNYPDYLLAQETITQTYFLDDLYPYLKYRINTSSLTELKNIHLVEEGLENKLVSATKSTNSLTELIASLTSKRYTQSRIQRMLVHILLNNTKEDIKTAINPHYFRILKMNNQGKAYLNSFKKTSPYPIITNLSNNRNPALEIELKAARLLSLLGPDLEILEFNNIPYHKI